MDRPTVVAVCAAILAAGDRRRDENDDTAVRVLGSDYTTSDHPETTAEFYCRAADRLVRAAGVLTERHR